MKKIMLGVLLFGLLGGGGYFAYRFRQEWTPHGYFESGKRYFDEKKYPEATIEFLNALRVAPRDRDARYYLALTYLRQNDFARGGQLLRSLVEMYPDDVEGSLELGRLYLTVSVGHPKSDLYRQAQELAEKVLSKDPQNVDALILSARASIGMQDFDASQNLLEKAVNLDPKNAAAFLSLGVNQANQKNYVEAEKALLKAREADPKDMNVLIALALYYRSRADAAKEEATWKEALALNPADKTVYYQLAVFYLRAGRVDEMEKVLRNAQAASPEDAGPTIMLANLYRAVDRSAEGRKMLLDARQKFPKSIDLAVQIAMIQMQDQPDEARKEVDRIIKLEPKNPVGHILLGEFQYKTGKFDEAEATLGKDPALNSLFPEVHFLLGNISRRKGQVDPAQDHYQKALALNGAYLPARLALAEVFVAKGRLQDSREEVKKALQVQPGNVAVRLLKVQLDMAEKKLPDAETGLSELLKDQPNNPVILRQMGIYQQIRGNSREAEKYLLRALDIAPDSEQLYGDLTGLYQVTKQSDRALQKLNSVPEKQAFHYELMGAILAQAGKAPEAETAFKKAIAKDPNRLSSEMLLTQLYVQTGRVDEGIKTLDDVAKKDPKNNEVLALKGNLLQLQGKTKEAAEYYTKALQGDPNIDLAANNLAYLLAEEGRDLQSALQYAQGVKKRKPEDPNTADTLGWVYFRLGRLVLAREQAEFAVSKDPNNGTFQYHLGIIYKSNNERTKAVAALKKAMASADFKEKSLASVALKDIER